MATKAVEWIPTSKKMPRRNQRVLVCWKARRKLYVDVDTYEGDGKFWLEYDNQPTHWAAMPSPPTPSEKP